MTELRYDLDSLGWYSFETLIQTLLKAEFGFGVEAWGGSGDWGRDAYLRGSLRLTSEHIIQGPVLFQAKFVAGANGAGARPLPLLLDAIGKELRRIEKRRDAGLWEEPHAYILVTNVALTAAARDEVTTRLRQTLPATEPVVTSGADVCALLDKHEVLRRAFPELLGLRDLQLLIQEAVHKDILERSRVTVELAKALAKVFVPTTAYARALAALGGHHFVVLDGPPEMGKTAIARIIAISQLSLGWAAIECRSPDDFFRSFDQQVCQVFLADDAFGRTEFNVESGRLWERDLPRILYRVDKDHWLLLTSRKHILSHALDRMDLTDPARSFPSPAEVIVDASQLSTEEKARILYRHAKSAGLEDKAKELLKAHIRLIVDDPNFTPERIRRFIATALPRLARQDSATATARMAIAAKIREGIRNPTKEMSVSYKALPPEHKWVLISVLESSSASPLEDIRHRYERLYTPISSASFTHLVEDLTGSFLRQTSDGKSVLHDWIHPSYRDLVIEQLIDDLDSQLRLLHRTDISGIRLAISTVGGARGERDYPFFRHATAISAVEARCVKLATFPDDVMLAQLLALFSRALGDEKLAIIRDALLPILRSICEAAVARWDKEGKLLTPYVLETYQKAATHLGTRLYPSMAATLNASILAAEVALASESLVESDLLSEVSAIVSIANSWYPDAPITDSRGSPVEELMSQLVKRVENQSHQDIDSDDYDALRYESDRLRELAHAVEKVPQELIKDNSVETVADTLRARADTYRELADEIAGESPYEGESLYDSGGSGFDVESVFRDL
jgi:hypothetical protein